MIARASYSPTEDRENAMIESYLWDKQYNQYTVDLKESDGYLDALVIWKRTIVGRIQCIVEPSNTVFIGNIEIFENPVLPRNGLFSLRPFQRPKRNFRQLGLGSAMLEYTIVLAERLGMVGIRGEVTMDDARKTPYLIEWYRRHGFTVTIRIRL